MDGAALRRSTGCGGLHPLLLLAARATDPSAGSSLLPPRPLPLVLGLLMQLAAMPV